jgi:hypothetical protein
MAVKHLASEWSGATLNEREAKRYPLHKLRQQGKDGHWRTVCTQALILPAQVPIRDAEKGTLFCVGCGNLVAASEEQVIAALAAAAAEGFVAAPGEQSMTPGHLSADARATLYALRDMAQSEARLYLTRTKASASELYEIGLVLDGVLTDAGRELVRLLEPPPLPPLQVGTPPNARNTRPRKAWIDSLIPRCANLVCYRPVPRDGVCSCGRQEADAARLTEIVRCWDIVDAQAPEKPKRARKTKAAGAEA